MRTPFRYLGFQWCYPFFYRGSKVLEYFQNLVGILKIVPSFQFIRTGFLTVFVGQLYIIVVRSRDIGMALHPLPYLLSSSTDAEILRGFPSFFLP